MLKHIKPRDIVEFFLFALGFIALMLLAAFLETAPLALTFWIAALLGFALWIVWAILVIRERKADSTASTLWVSNGQEWVAADGSGRRRPFKTNTGFLFDQEEHKEKA